MKEIIERLSKIEHGFQHVEAEAIKIFQSKTIKETINIAKDLLENEIYQARMLAVFLLGYAAPKDSSALEILKTKVSKDSNWRVQEILAKSFDFYCNEIGYEKSLPVIKDWLNASNPNVCRAVTEGLRIWTNRSYFKTNPQVAIKLISQHRANDSEYLRKSVGNSLRDISKRHKQLVNEEIATWDLKDKRTAFTYKYVTKTNKNNMKKVVAFIGSPRRNGNTETIVNKILKGAEEAGAVTRSYFINEMNIKLCQSCFSCRTEKNCKQIDDMQMVYEDIKNADAIVLGSPIYFAQVSAQTKLLMDRLFPIIDAPFKPRYGNKKAILAFFQNNSDPERFKQYIDYMTNGCLAIGWEAKSMLFYDLQAQTNEVKEKREKEAFDEGKKLVSL